MITREATERGKEKAEKKLLAFQPPEKIQVVCGNSGPSPYWVKLHPPGSGVSFAALLRPA